MTFDRTGGTSDGFIIIIINIFVKRHRQSYRGAGLKSCYYISKKFNYVEVRGIRIHERGKRPVEFKRRKDNIVPP